MEWCRDISPMLAVKGEPFDSAGHIYEIKWDGIRCLAYLDSMTRLKSRNNNNITEGYPELKDMYKWVKQGRIVLDGEIVIMKDGRPSFSEWQKRSGLKPGRISSLKKTNPAVYIVFDVLYVNGKSIMEAPLIERKSILLDIINEQPSFIISQYIEEYGKDFYKAAVEHELEGVVAKKKDSPYLPGKRSLFWQKFKNSKQEDFVICGYLKGAAEIRSLILGAYSSGALIYQGLVGTGFNGRIIKVLLDKFKENKTYPFKEQIKEIAGGIWVVPEMVCTVEFLEKKAGSLRHPSFIGLRTDKNPEECRIDQIKELDS